MGFPMYPIGGAAIPAVDTVPPPVLPYYSSQTPSSSSSSPSPYPIYAMPIAQGPPPTTAAPSMGYPVYPMYAGVYATAPYMQSINGTAIPYGIIAPQYVPQYQVQQQLNSFVPAPIAPAPTAAPSAPARSVIDEDASPKSDIARALSSLDLMSDASLKKQERCRHCGFYFDPDANKADSCTYHPGTFATPDTVTPIMMPISNLQRWTCCRGSDQRASSGCRTGPHVVDRHTSVILKQFEKSLRSAPSKKLPGGNLIDLSDNKEDAEAEGSLYPKLDTGLNRAQILGGKQIKSEADPTKNMVRHTVALTDTLSGLSVRYGVKVEDIKRANNLIGDSVFERKYVDIPNPTRVPSEEELASRPMPKEGRDRIEMERFALLAQCSKQEAKYYLTEYADFKKAMAAYKEDKEWERSSSPSEFARRIVKIK